MMTSKCWTYRFAHDSPTEVSEVFIQTWVICIIYQLQHRSGSHKAPWKCLHSSGIVSRDLAAIGRSKILSRFWHRTDCTAQFSVNRSETAHRIVCTAPRSKQLSYSLDAIQMSKLVNSALFWILYSDWWAVLRDGYSGSWSAAKYPYLFEQGRLSAYTVDIIRQRTTLIMYGICWRD